AEKKEQDRSRKPSENAPPVVIIDKKIADMADRGRNDCNCLQPIGGINHLSRASRGRSILHLRLRKSPLPGETKPWIRGTPQSQCAVVLGLTRPTVAGHQRRIYQGSERNFLIPARASYCSRLFGGLHLMIT